MSRRTTPSPRGEKEPHIFVQTKIDVTSHPLLLTNLACCLGLRWETRGFPMRQTCCSVNEPPEEHTHAMKLEDLKCTLSTIAKHVSSLITDAENRAREGNSPNPSARGGFGTIPTAATPITQAEPTSEITPTTRRVETASAAAARGASPPLPPLLRTTAAGDCETNDSLQHDDSEMVVVEPKFFTAAVCRGGNCREEPGTPPMAGISTVKSTAGSAVPTSPESAGKTSTVEVPARTRVLRRVSSVRGLFLGVAKEGERLANFSRQMGLPHDIVVAHFRVRRMFVGKIETLQNSISFWFYVLGTSCSFAI